MLCEGRTKHTARTGHNRNLAAYDKDQYIDAEVLAQSPSGSYAYQDADGNVYTAWFGLSY